MKQFPQVVEGISASNYFDGLLTVMCHFYNPQVYLMATGFFDSAAVTVLPYCLSSGNVLSFVL